MKLHYCTAVSLSNIRSHCRGVRSPAIAYKRGSYLISADVVVFDAQRPSPNRKIKIGKTNLVPLLYICSQPLSLSMIPLSCFLSLFFAFLFCTCGVAAPRTTGKSQRRRDLGDLCSTGEWRENGLARDWQLRSSVSVCAGRRDRFGAVWRRHLPSGKGVFFLPSGTFTAVEKCFYASWCVRETHNRLFLMCRKTAIRRGPFQHRQLPTHFFQHRF